VTPPGGGSDRVAVGFPPGKTVLGFQVVAH
jgi:hypothetical protein